MHSTPAESLSPGQRLEDKGTKATLPVEDTSTFLNSESHDPNSDQTESEKDEDHPEGIVTYVACCDRMQVRDRRWLKEGRKKGEGGKDQLGSVYVVEGRYSPLEKLGEEDDLLGDEVDEVLVMGGPCDESLPVG